MEDQLNQSEGLIIIEQMINKARNQFTENGHLYLLWGWLILICSIGHFIMQNILHLKQFWMVWTLTWAGVIYQVVYIVKRNKERTVATYTDDIIKYIWIVFFICMALFSGIAQKNNAHSYDVNIVFLILYGMPTFLSGMVLKFKPLWIGGICCWVLSLFTFIIEPIYYMLLISIAMIAAWIVPGYLLRSKYKRHAE